MKYFFLTTILLFSLTINAQEEVHFLWNKDSITDCSFIKSGKFVNEESDSKITEGYSIEFRNGFAVEKIEDGKYFLKSKITYTSECSYEMKVLETNIPGYDGVVGKTFFTEILETAKADKLTMIRSREDKDWKTLVLRKIED
jgi:hypothetical protein